MRIGKDMCERKAYPHKVCPDRNRTRLRVNEALILYPVFAQFLQILKIKF